MIQQRLALSWLPRPVVRGHQVVVLRVEADRSGTTADPDGLADQAEGDRVVGAVNGDVAVAIDCDLLPTGRVVGDARQGEERGFSPGQFQYDQRHDQVPAW